MSVQPEAAPVIVPGKAQTTRRAWGILLFAGVCEIAFAVSTDGSRGFTNLPWSIATVVAAAATIFTLSLALRTIDVGVGYAVWTGIGASGAAIFGAIIFGESLGPLRILFLAVIIAGVICLKLAGGSTDSAKTDD
ncbi:DMT family transporter [Amycolatopsis sp. GA6-003]|uniref:DMT family transporter n=1 Tax=Amycolatopsis sp. GA6-003 TaxID=2652444 RepID=UPI0039170733